jgi:hypothetical protein
MKILIKAVRTALPAAFLVAALHLFAGCGGGGATYQAAGNKTLGEELQDLQQSYEKGIITKSQYEDTKKKLIKKYTR